MNSGGNLQIDMVLEGWLIHVSGLMFIPVGFSTLVNMYYNRVLSITKSYDLFKDLSTSGMGLFHYSIFFETYMHIV